MSPLRDRDPAGSVHEPLVAFLSQMSALTWGFAETLRQTSRGSVWKRMDMGGHALPRQRQRRVSPVCLCYAFTL